MKILLPALLFLAACGSTSVKKKIQLAELGNDEKVTIYREMPTFGYEVICEVEIERKGNFVSTDLEAYRSNLEVEARKCGGKQAFLSGLSGFRYGSSANVTITGYVIRQTTEEMKIKDKEHVKKLAQATNLNNESALKKLLIAVNPSPLKRSPHDNEILSLLLHTNAKIGLNCPAKTVNLLLNQYQVRIKNLHPKLSVLEEDPREIGFCQDVLAKSYLTITDRDKLLTYANNVTVGLLNYFSGSNEDFRKLQRVNTFLPMVMSEIKLACSKDETSSGCIMRERFQEIRAHVEKLSPKVKQPAIKKELDILRSGIKI